jgi:hypothetical protein
MSLAFANGFSGPGTQVLVDQAKEGVRPATATDAYLSHVQPWTGLTGEPETVYDPAVWETYYEARQATNLRNI